MLILLWFSLDFFKILCSFAQINGVLMLYDSSFTSCVSDGFGGCGIYLYLDLIINQLAKLANLRFYIL